MAIDKFLQEYRDYMYTKDMLLNKIDSSTSRTDLYVIIEYSGVLLKELSTSSLYIDTTIFNIEKEIEDIYNRIHLKLDKILELAEGYQSLNTNEVLSEPINSFSVFEIKNNLNFNSFYEALTLKNINKIKNKTPDRIEKSNINAVEYFIFDENNINNYLRVNIKDSINTILKTINVYNHEGELIQSLSESALIRLDKDIARIEVITDNEISDKAYYTRIDILEDFYQSSSTINLEDVTFKKEGSKLKINFDYDLPTENYGTVKITIKYKDNITNKIKQETIYTGLNTTRDILVNKQELESLNVRYEKTKDSYILNTDLIEVKTFSTNPNLFKSIGYGVYDISKINSDIFTISLVIDIYSLIDKNKTPKIKGIYGYVTK